MAEPVEREMDRYLRGELSAAEARELAQAALDRRGLFEELTLAAVALHGVSAQPSSDGLESYIGGRLSASGQRELAQAALSNHELFDALAAHGAVEKSLDNPAFQAAVAGEAPRQNKVVSFPRRFRLAAMGAIAAAIAAVAVYWWRPVAPSKPAVATTSGGVLSASLDPGAGKPTLLARDLGPTSSSGAAAPVFRSTEPESRAPQPEGSIVALDNLVATVNLGSLDGLAKGAQLEIFHGASKQPSARLEVTTIFRDRARGFITAGSPIQVNDRVRVAAPIYLSAVLEQVGSLADRGDMQAARQMARDALNWAKSNGIAPSETRAILERLAALDYKNRDLSAAEQDYQSLADGFASPPPAGADEQDAIFNAWGSLLLLRGDTAQAELKFRQTHDADGLNNAGVLAELRGQNANAQALYEAALRILDKSPSASPRDRQTIEANVARLARGVHENR
jgi:tetratricopeptide (TPR) repeat protein